MALIRLAHVADLPGPEELVRRLSGFTAAGAGPGPRRRRTHRPRIGRLRGRGPGAAGAGAAPAPAPAPGPLARYARFEDMVALVGRPRHQPARRAR